MLSTYFSLLFLIALAILAAITVIVLVWIAFMEPRRRKERGKEWEKGKNLALAPAVLEVALFTIGLLYKLRESF